MFIHTTCFTCLSGQSLNEEHEGFSVRPTVLAFCRLRASYCLELVKLASTPCINSTQEPSPSILSTCPHHLAHAGQTLGRPTASDMTFPTIMSSTGRCHSSPAPASRVGVGSHPGILPGQASPLPVNSNQITSRPPTASYPWGCFSPPLPKCNPPRTDKIFGKLKVVRS